MRKFLFCFVLIIAAFYPTATHAQKDTLYYQIDTKDAANHIFSIQLTMRSQHDGVLDLKIPEWTPGYYQMLHFSQNIRSLKVFSENSNPLSFAELDENTWRVAVKKNQIISIQYEVLANENFIAKPYIGESWAFVRPTGVFIYPFRLMSLPAKITFINNKWPDIATALNKSSNGFVAANVDELLDCPILIGDLEDIPTFVVKGIPHYFSGREFGYFDKNDLSESLEKMVKSTVDLMGDVPYEHFYFLAIGHGNGGIEQTNSTAFAFDSNELNDSAGRLSVLNFLTHEYFHHFNIKRIRPIELGPFDYSTENRTNLLWVSEGLTVYFEDVILNRAGLKSRDQMLANWGSMIGKYENNPGKQFQTLAQSSYHTWEDGPFGIRGKTISYYEKGPIIGMLLDLTIRVNSGNKYSLIDVMKKLYQKYYKEENRGFTEKEMRDVCEKLAGTSMEEIFSYIYTTLEIDYDKYFIPAGLQIRKSNELGKLKFNILPVNQPNKVQKTIVDDLFGQ